MYTVKVYKIHLLLTPTVRGALQKKLGRLFYSWSEPGSVVHEPKQVALLSPTPFQGHREMFLVKSVADHNLKN